MQFAVLARVRLSFATPYSMLNRNPASAYYIVLPDFWGPHQKTGYKKLELPVHVYQKFDIQEVLWRSAL